MSKLARFRKRKLNKTVNAGREIPKPTKKELTNFWSKVDKKGKDDCWFWKAGKTANGYGELSINKKTYTTHRISFSIHNPNTKIAGLLVCHHCDNPACINPHHLFLGTQSDNMNDCVNKGRDNKAIGENGGSAKLTEQQAIEIINKLSKNTRNKEIAKEYDLGSRTVTAIKRGDSWAHLDRSKIPIKKELSKNDVEKIRTRLDKGHTQRKIAKDFGVTQTTISNIKTGVAWSKKSQISNTHYHKLTEKEVLEIRKKLSGGIGRIKLSKEYNVSTRTISAIRTRKSWKYLK